MPETSKLEKLNWELEKSEKKLRKAINDEKALQYQLKQLRGAEHSPKPFHQMHNAPFHPGSTHPDIQWFL